MTTSRRRTRASQPRSGFTLIEIMVALLITLIVLLVMMRAFRYANEEIAKGRAMIELSNQLRTTQEVLRTDLAGVTANMRPLARYGSPSGYFEYVEGPSRDDSAVVAGRVVDAMFGDVDDILCFTTRSDGQAYRGRIVNFTTATSGHNTSIIESNLAEVVWWTDFRDVNSDNDRLDYEESLFIRRRALLIRPDINLSAVPASTFGEVQTFFLNNDISARWVDTDNNGARDKLVANSLEDLDKRENRFAHFPLNSTSATYPFALDRETLAAFKLSSSLPANLSGQQEYFAGNDIANTEAVAFDVRIFSRNAPIRATNGIPLIPGDDGFSGGTDLALGCFVDLSYAGTVPFASNLPAFSTVPLSSPQNPALDFAFPSTNWMSGTPGDEYVVDTFTRYYEMNGIDEDAAMGIDQANNGVDDNVPPNGIDDDTERETLPPYPYEIVGIEVTLGVHERTSKQLRRTAVVVKFEPGN